LLAGRLLIRLIIVKHRVSPVYCAVMFAAASVGSAQTSARPQTVAVFTAVLDSLYRSQGDKPSMVIVADSLYWREGAIVYRGTFYVPHRSAIAQSTIESFEHATDRASPFPQSYRYKGVFRVLSASEYAQILARGNVIASKIPPRELREMPYWMAFVEKYPAAWGVTVLSGVGFNTDSSEALIFVRHQCGGGCYSAEVILLDRVVGRWRIVERMNTGSNEGMGSGSMRYLGPGAHFISDLRRRQDSTRRAYSDSVKRDRAPRQIRGTVFNRVTGKPLPYAQIFARSPKPYPTGSTQRVVADSHGRYSLRNPPIGGMMLEVQCPGARHRIGATLDAPGLYVLPMLDTIIDVGPPNLEPCWWPRYPHRISSGELEARLRTALAHPSDAERQIYSAVSRDTKLDSTHFLVDAETHPWCNWEYGCPKLSIAHLVTKHQVDSTTVTSFRHVAQDTVPLSPAGMGMAGMRLFSRGERSYVWNEAARISEFGGDTARAITPWSVLRDLYGSNAIVEFTRVGLNDTGDEAIVAFRLKVDEDVESETVLVRRSEGAWKVVRRHLESERSSADLVGGRCVPVPQAGKPTAQEMQTIKGDYDFDLVSSATDSHVVKWSMRFLRDSSSRTVFEILDPKSRGRLKDLEPGTHISGGPVGFSNAAGLMQFDGFGHSLVIDRVEGDQLFGSWESYSFGIPVGRDGKPIPEPAGHFCAVKRQMKSQ
jgi:hypothetical protein